RFRVGTESGAKCFSDPSLGAALQEADGFRCHLRCLGSVRPGEGLLRRIEREGEPQFEGLARGLTCELTSMDGVSDEDLVVPRGLARTVAYARDAAGRRPAWEFLHGEIPARDRAQLFHLFVLLAA